MGRACEDDELIGDSEFSRADLKVCPYEVSGSTSMLMSSAGAE